MNSNKINQKEYLKKYLIGDIRKKKKKGIFAQKSTINIVDDDIELSHAADSELDNYTLGEDLPQIAGIIDERPADLIAKEDYKTNRKWKTIENDKVVNSSEKREISVENSCNAVNKLNQSSDSLKYSNPNVNTSRGLSNVPRRSKDMLRSPDEETSPRCSIQSIDSSHPRRLKYSNQSLGELPQERSKQSPDISPPRRSKDINRNPDESPPRRLNRNVYSSDQRYSKHSIQSPDTFPPRRSKDIKRNSNEPPSHLKRNSSGARAVSSSPLTHKKISKTLEGKNAGLQNVKALREENEQFRKREDEMFRQMQTADKQKSDLVVYGRKTGRHRRLHEGDCKDREKLQKEKERKQIYDRWGLGLKQIEDYKKQVVLESREMNKPIARYANDEDLEEYLRSQCRDGDPMATYFRKKANDLQTGPRKPIYQGSFPENRFSIRPGYRWDGVDRSNGYEKKWFEVLNQKKAIEEDAYKFSVEDM